MPILTAKIERQAKYLVENGFIEGEHFKRVLEKRTLTDYVYYYSEDIDGSRDVYTFTYEILEASILLKYKRFNGSSGMRNYTNAIDIDSNGLIEEGGNLMAKRGKFKPSTILAKIIQTNEIAFNSEVAFEKNEKNIKLMIADLEKFYPSAKVTTHLNIRHRDNYLPFNTEIIKVLFPSGSYVEIALGKDGNEDKVAYRYDAELSNLTMVQVLNKFNQQEPCGVEATA